VRPLGPQWGVVQRGPGAKNETARAGAPWASSLAISELRLLGPPALILPSAYLTNPLRVKVEGGWGFEKAGETLPRDYVPDAVKWARVPGP
jgi:hypothetical protein